MNVISLFGGMEVFRQSLKDLNIPVEKYYSSEIYKEAITVANKNHDDIIQLGDIRGITIEDLKTLPKIDLIGFGFPCKNLSKNVINKKDHYVGLKGKFSSLFFEAVRILEWIQENNNPNVYFICENVVGMNVSDKTIITNTLGVTPVEINSSSVSAQDRPRYYWTNIQIESLHINYDSHLKLKDIVSKAEDVADKYWYDVPFTYNGDNERVQATLHINGYDILKRVYNLNSKCPTLTACRGGNKQKKVYQNGRCRKLTPTEYEILQTVPIGYTEGVSDTARYNMLGDGWTLKVISYILSFLPSKFFHTQ